MDRVTTTCLDTLIQTMMKIETNLSPPKPTHQTHIASYCIVTPAPQKTEKTKTLPPPPKTKQQPINKWCKKSIKIKMVAQSKPPPHFVQTKINVASHTK